jgi:tetratricopeptide (TPR) repeat protein
VAFKEKQWDKAITHYTDAIELNGTNATYYCNRAAALLKLGWYEVFLSVNNTLTLTISCDCYSHLSTYAAFS